MQEDNSTLTTGRNLSESMVSEPLVPYGGVMSLKAISPDILRSLDAGIPVSDITRIMEKYEFTQSEMADLLHLTPKTLRKKIQDGGHTDSLQGSLVIALDELCQVGLSVLGSHQTFLRWIRTPSVALGGSCPREFFSTFQGIRLIQSELESIAEGTYA